MDTQYAMTFQCPAMNCQHQHMHLNIQQSVTVHMCIVSLSSRSNSKRSFHKINVYSFVNKKQRSEFLQLEFFKRNDGEGFLSTASWKCGNYCVIHIFVVFPCVSSFSNTFSQIFLSFIHLVAELTKQRNLQISSKKCPK